MSIFRTQRNNKKQCQITEIIVTTSNNTYERYLTIDVKGKNQTSL